MTTLILIGVVVWLVIVLAVLALLRCAARADEAAERQRRELLMPGVESFPDSAQNRRALGFAGRVKRRLERMDAQHDGIVALMLDLAARDPAAAAHAAAVAHYARALARAGGATEREQAAAHTAGLLHDIGLLTAGGAGTGRAAGPATAGNVAERHPVEGARLLRHAPALTEIADAVEAHHERVDGTGYPHGLRGDEIPQLARILAIAEVYDTLSAADSYRDGIDAADVVDELRRVSGHQLDGELVEIFVTSVLAHADPGVRPTLERELRAVRSP